MSKIEVCFSPLLFQAKGITKPYIVVVIDILRASTSLCTAIQYGVKEIIPVASLEEAQEYKQQGFLVAGERDGSILDFADVGNSPASFMTGDFKDKTLAFTTTNGTVAINLAKDADEIVIGAFSNLSSLAEWLANKGKAGYNVLMLCSGWYNQFSLEDSLFAGCLSQKLMESGVFEYNCDSVKASINLWETAKSDLFSYVQKATHYKRLQDLNLTEDLTFCFTLDTVDVIPILQDGKLVRLKL